MPSVIFFILGVAVVLGVAAFMLSLVVTYLRQVHEAPPLPVRKCAGGMRTSSDRPPGPTPIRRNSRRTPDWLSHYASQGDRFPPVPKAEAPD